MKRKVNRVGTNTLTVSLPAGWVKRNSVKAGDEVEVSCSAKEVLISRTVKLQHKSITIRIERVENLPRRTFIIPYLQGYDEIKIYYGSADVIKFIEKNLFILTGFEIVEQSPKFILIRNITSIEEKNLNTVISRVYTIVRSMLNETKGMFETGDFASKESVVCMEDMVNKLDFYCRRILNVYGHAESGSLAGVYFSVRSLETISDTIRDLLQQLPSGEHVKNALAKDAIGLLMSLLDMNRQIMESREIGNRLSHFKEKEQEFLRKLGRIKSCTLRMCLYSMYHQVHHMNEEALSCTVKGAWQAA